MCDTASLARSYCILAVVYLRKTRKLLQGPQEMKRKPDSTHSVYIYVQPQNILLRNYAKHGQQLKVLVHCRDPSLFAPIFFTQSGTHKQLIYVIADLCQGQHVCR